MLPSIFPASFTQFHSYASYCYHCVMWFRTGRLLDEKKKLSPLEVSKLAIWLGCFGYCSGTLTPTHTYMFCPESVVEQQSLRELSLTWAKVPRWPEEKNISACAASPRGNRARWWGEGGKTMWTRCVFFLYQVYDIFCPLGNGIQCLIVQTSLNS